MATYTDNFGLVKSAYGEKADVAVINGNMDTIDGIMHSNRTMLAPAFSQTEDYAVGDVVVYEGNLYRFIVPHTAGNWDGTEVEQTTLGEEVSTKGGADVTKTASGNPITFDDGADAPLVKCITEIQGSQDLHGYTKPWVGGAGKNLLQVTTTTQTVSGVTFTVNGDGTINTSGTATARIAFPLATNSAETPILNKNIILNGCPSNGGLSTYFLQWYGYDGASASENDIGNGTNAFTPTSTAGSIAIVIQSGINVDNLVFKPMARLSTETDPTFAPYSNICPISGYSSVEVNESNGGADVYDSEGTEGYNVNSLIEIISKNSFRVYNTRNQTYASSRQDISIYNLVVGNTYTIEADVTVSSGVGLLSIRNSSNSILASTDTITQNGHYKFSFVAILEMARLSFFCTYDTSTTGDVTYSNIRLYEGSELKEYTISLGDTYYSGQIDAVRGVLVADKGYYELPSTNWVQETGYPGVYTNYAFGVSNSYPQLICSASTRGSSYSNILNTDSRIGISASRIIWHESAFASVNDLMTYLSNNVVQIVYNLATPIEIPLTPTVISSLLGSNTMWTDGDNLEIEYITEEFQPIVDLIESNKHVYSTAEQIVGTWIDGSTLYEKSYHVPTVTSTYITIDSTISASTIKLRNVSMGSIVIGGAYNNAQYVDGRLSYDSFIRVVLNEGLSVGMDAPPSEPIIDFDFTIRYTKSTPTRSLNLTKSAVTEIPEEIKNAEYEEKPETNEADDDAPTEVDER